MKGTTKPKIHVVIKNVVKFINYKGKKCKYKLVKNPFVLISNINCANNNDLVWAMIDLFSKACTGAFEDEHYDDDRYYDRDCYWDDSYFAWN